MRRIRKSDWFSYESLTISAIVTVLIFIVVMIFVWKFFLKTPEVSVRFNQDNLTMVQVLENDNVVLSSDDWKKYGHKFRIVFPYIVTVKNGYVDLARFRQDFPDNNTTTAIWISKFEIPHVFLSSPISPQEFHKKYVTR